VLYYRSSIILGCSIATNSLSWSKLSGVGGWSTSYAIVLVNFIFNKKTKNKTKQNKKANKTKQKNK
jgi:hypothetical protein